jgi:ribosomal protein S18 acetylase RimI-like enzyme
LARDSKTAAPKLSLRIRPATPADAAAIARLHHASHTTSFAPFASAAWLAARDPAAYARDWRERLAAADARGGTWIALADGEVVGVMSALPETGDAADPAVAMLRAVHVDPRRLGLGIGRALWIVVTAALRARGFARARFDVIEANARARRFFEAAGGRCVGRAPAGVEGVPIVTYELDLASAAAAPAG